ncbi:MAG TPA: 2-amino-4-hydroxy-6-hydroxymethyldihydropteridine diphosphokinase [Acidimicrobiales bacterium]|nr:2-amino-4-hydroxy-6-hydroxymethyldihydropteridine diphosphokinase [Acidimicrobiales bacterium]
MRVFLGLGSNMGDRRAHLRDAVHSLPGVVAVSPVYETDPIGGPDQPPYLNCVVELDVDLTPRQLLGICHRLESAAHRVRTLRWGPRTLDVDILLVGDTTVDEPDLQIPHPRMRQRRFVLQPLRDLAPELVAEDLDRLGGRVRPAGTL